MKTSGETSNLALMVFALLIFTSALLTRNSPQQIQPRDPSPPNPGVSMDCGPRGCLMVRFRISPEGSVISQTGTAVKSSRRISAGLYRVDLARVFKGTPNCTVMGPGTAFASLKFEDTTSVYFHIRGFSDGHETYVDSELSVFCMGERA